MRKSIKKNVKSVNNRRVKNKNKVKSNIKKGGAAAEVAFEDNPVAYLNTTYAVISAFADGTRPEPIIPISYLTNFLQCVISLENRGFTVQFVEGMFRVIPGKVPDAEGRYFNKTNHAALVKAMDIDTFLGDGTTKVFNDFYNLGLDGPKVRKTLTQGVSNIAQCQSSRGAGDFHAGRTFCVWCGVVIEELAECEHVLPVLAASALLKFGHPRREPDEPTDIELAWAHRVCNQRKNDDLFIRWNGSWIRNERGIVNFYRDLGDPKFMGYSSPLYPNFNFNGEEYTGHKYRSILVPHYHSNIKDIIAAAHDEATTPGTIGPKDSNGKTIGLTRIDEVLEYLRSNFTGSEDAIKCRMLCKFFCCVAGKDLISVIMGRLGEDPHKAKMQAYSKLKNIIETRRIEFQTALKETDSTSIIKPNKSRRVPNVLSGANEANNFFTLIRRIWSEFDSITTQIRTYNKLPGPGPNIGISLDQLTGITGSTSANIERIIAKDLTAVQDFFLRRQTAGSKKQKGGSFEDLFERIEYLTKSTNHYLNLPIFNKIIKEYLDYLISYRNLLYNHLYKLLKPLETMRLSPSTLVQISTTGFINHKAFVLSFLGDNDKFFLDNYSLLLKPKPLEEYIKDMKKLAAQAAAMENNNDDEGDDDDEGDEGDAGGDGPAPHPKSGKVSGKRTKGFLAGMSLAAQRALLKEAQYKAMGRVGGSRKKKNTKKKKPQKKTKKKRKKLK